MKMFRRIVSATLAFSLVFPIFTEYRKASNIVSATDTSVMYGDVNGDKKITILDLIKLKAYVTGNSTSGFIVKAADVDSDGKVSAKDAVELVMYLLNQTGSFSYEMNIDSDKDGLSDYIEKEILGTDYLDEKTDWDTDKDGISDYDEVYILGTDPKSEDTGNTGIKDSLKDDDNDGLNNLEEIKYKTSPKLADTDNDGLSDYDEIHGDSKYKYTSDPLKADTDNDGISDYGEIKLGLNPKSNKSDGVNIDSVRKISQSISADNKKLSSVNTENNPYQLSLTADTTGFIEEILDVKISDYSAFLMEDEIYGSIVDIECYEGYSISKLNLNFKLKNVSDPKDYIIFRYSDADGILLPTNTQYNSSNLYLSDCEPGTYCIVNVADMAKYYEEDINEFALADSMTAKAGSGTVNVLYEIAISNDCTVKSWSQIESAMKNVAQKLENANKSFKFTLVFTAFKYSVSISCSSSAELKQICDTATDFFNDSSITSSTAASNAYTKNVKQGLPVWKDLSSPSTGFSDKSYYNSGNVIISFNGTGTEVRKCLSISSGGLYSCAVSLNISRYTKSYYNTLLKYGNSSLGDKLYQLLVYDQSVTSKYPCRLSLFGKKLLNSVITPGSKVDSDGDGNSDDSEIIGNYLLSKLVKSSADTSVFISRINLKIGGSLTADDIILTTVKSDPTRTDSDEDGIPDSEDKKPKKADYKKIDDKLLDDSKIFDEGYSKTVNKTLSEGVILNSNTGDKPNPYVDYRNSKYAKDRNSYPSRYEITPVSNSDYRITVDTALNDNCDVYVYEKGFLYNDTEIKSTITDDNKKYIKDESGNVKHNNYQYILEAGKTYQVVVIVCSLDNRRECYDVKVEQDNWVYANDGGLWKISDFSFKSMYLGYLHSQSLYLTPKRISSVVYKSTGNMVDITLDSDGNIEEQINAILNNNGMQVTDDDLKSAIDTLNGATANTILFFIPIPSSKLKNIYKLIVLTLSAQTNYSTYIGVPDSIKTVYNYMEQQGFIRAFSEGNRFICSSKYSTSIDKVWDPWTSAPYINKYNEFSERGVVTVNVSDEEFENWLNWKGKVAG